MNEFIEQFIIESREHVEQATSALATLAVAPRDAGALEALFRALHTLKGSAGIVDFVAMERLLHVAETALSPVRSGVLLSARLNADCLSCLDLIVRWLDAMERSGDLPAGADAQISTLVARLGGHAEQHEIQQQDSAAQAGAAASLPEPARALLEAQLALLDEKVDETLAGRVASAGRTAASVLAWCGLDTVAGALTRAMEESLLEGNPLLLRERIAQALQDASAAPQAVATATASASADVSVRTLRIDAARIETLVRLIGELTVIKNAIGHTANVAQSDAQSVAGKLKNQHGVLDRITSEVQSTVLAMRVLPLRTVFGRFPPMVREMAAHLGKPARLVIEGDDTEADKAIVEMLFEPLLHVVRNAMDHGVETPAGRARAGKPPEAVLVMRASRQGDRVLIEVEDDGSGIDAVRVRQLALERGIVTVEALAELSEAEIINLVFASGFSTAETVTELSGRGVGMDAVRMAVGRLHGAVSLDSRSGRGTTVRFSLPFSVMMTQVMTVEAGGQTFGIPLDAVIETIRVPVSSLAGVGAALAVALRDRTLSVFELASLLKVQAQGTVSAQAENEAVIVVVAFAGQWGGIRVKRPGERMEVMLKPLEGLLSGIPGITGTTIMGDGRVLLVLDLAEILLI
jgi:two-component system chemotaxis sensor kinase CheA